MNEQPCAGSVGWRAPIASHHGRVNGMIGCNCETAETEGNHEQSREKKVRSIISNSFQAPQVRAPVDHYLESQAAIQYPEAQ